MNVTAKEVRRSFGGFLPQVIADTVFLPEGCDGLAYGNPAIAFKCALTPKGRKSSRTIDLCPVTVEGYRYRMIVFAGCTHFVWVREDLCPDNPSHGLSLQVVPWSAEVEYGIREESAPVSASLLKPLFRSARRGQVVPTSSRFCRVAWITRNNDFFSDGMGQGVQQVYRALCLKKRSVLRVKGGAK